MSTYVLSVFFFLVQVHFLDALRGIDLYFESNPTTPRALLVSEHGFPIRELVTDKFTFCFFVKIEANSKLEKVVSLVSFSSEEADEYNELLLEINYNPNYDWEASYTSFYVDGKGVPLDRVPHLNQWTHVCLSWSSQKGKVRLYLDGKLVCCKKGIQIGHVIRGGGILVLGQDQDYFNDGFDPETGLTGRMTQFNMWSKELTPYEVNGAYNCRYEGDVITWSNSSWAYYNGLMIKPSQVACASNSCPFHP